MEGPLELRGSLRRAILALICALAILSAPPIAPAQGPAAEPILRIAEVGHPASVAAGEPFEVRVSIEYSYGGWTIADLGIFAGDLTRIVDCVRYFLTGSGSRQFSLRALAPPEAGAWNLTIVARAWHGNYWLEPSGARRALSIWVEGPNRSIASPIPAEPARVRIGDSEWYYWGRPGSGVCLIWLGGGHAMSYYITVNPYELESFGTMRLIADLASLYSVLAPAAEGPRRGDRAHWSGPALRYSPGGSQLRAVREWALGEGHGAAFLIGYSTGGVAAAYEVASADPEGWAAPNGAVIISAPLGGVSRGILASIPDSRSVRANALLLYGRVYGDELWPQGLRFFEGIPDGGIRGAWAQRKAWRLFEGSGHEVWFPEGDGVRYDRGPFSLIAGFIEDCGRPIGARSPPSANLSIALEPPHARVRAEFLGHGFLGLWGEFLGGGERGLGEALASRASGMGSGLDARSLALEVDAHRRSIRASFRALGLARRDGARAWSIDLGWLGDRACSAIRIDGGFLITGNSSGRGPLGCPGPYSVHVALPSGAIDPAFDPMGPRISFGIPGPSLAAQVGASKSPGPGGAYSVSLTIRNDGPGIARYNPSDLDFAIIDPVGREVYRRSRSGAGGLAGGEEELPPGGSRSYAFEWDGRGEGGAPLPPGTYEVRAYLGDLELARARVLVEGAVPGFEWPAMAIGAPLGLSALRLLRLGTRRARRCPRPPGRR